MTTTFAHLPLRALVASPTNPRTIFDPAWITELAESIKVSGVIQPILVRPLPGSRVADTDRGVTHEIVEGECRWRGSKEAGTDTIPAMVRELTDLEVIEIQLISFLKRKGLTELEEAQGYQSLMDAAQISADEVGKRIKKSRSYVFGRLKLLDLCIEARTSLAAGTIDASRGLLLARIPDHKLQIKALEEITRKNYADEIDMSARDAARHIQREYMLHLDRARFTITDAALVPEAGSCKTCPKRTGCSPDLFADVQGADVCTDPPCFHKKEQAHTDAQLRVAHERGQTIIDGREAKELMPNSWGKVEGYLRLDEESDSPTDKPLRKLLGKQIEAEGIQPTLIANPHKAGELIAVLPSHQVAELLKAKGHEDAAQRVDATLQASAKAEATAAKAKLETDYEQGWRTAVLERIAGKLKDSDGAYDLGREVLRHIALHYAHQCNTDRAKRLCKLLDLGKVAPLLALHDYVRDAEHPQDVLQLLVAAADVEYRAYLTNQDDANQGLLLVADDNLVSVDKVKAEVKAQMRGEAVASGGDRFASPAVKYRGVNGECWTGRGLQPRWVRAHIEAGGALADLEVQKAPVPLASAAQAKGVRGAKKPKIKTSAAQAQIEIAAAMQAQDTDSGADAQGDEVDSSQPVATCAPADAVASPEPPVALAVDALVVVTDDYQRLPITQHKWSGKQGVITQGLDDDRWMVSFGIRGMCAFDVADLQLVTLTDDQVEPAAVATMPEPVDPLYQGALDIVKRERKVSIRLIKAGLAVGTAKAVALIDQLAAAGAVGDCDARGAREVLVAA